MKKRDSGDDIGMVAKSIDKSLMMVFLLEECNFSCIHCVREDEPMCPGYKLSFEQLKLCLSDCHNLQSAKWIHFSGGEPTLWTDGELDLVDLLKEISNAGFEPGFTTNGSCFADYNKCNDLFEKYFNSSNKPLHLYISIDTFHRNFDVEKGRSKSLDNIIKYKREMSSEKRNLLNLIVLVVVSKEPNSLLPDEMIEHYKSLGGEFSFVPLLPIGKAKSFSHLCPNLKSDKPEDLGAYYRFHQKKKERDAKTNMVLIGNDYYLPDPWRKVARLEHLPKKIIDVYLNEVENCHWHPILI